MTISNTPSPRPVRRLSGYLLLLPILGLAACATPPERPELAPLTFPPPPETARFVFERTLTGSADIEEDDKTSRLRRLATGAGRTSVVFSKPFDVVACKGRIFVTDTVKRMVMVFDAPGRRFNQIGTTEPGELTKPLGLNVDAECNLYVVDSTLKVVKVYRADGTFLKAFGGRDWFDRPSHIAVTADGSRAFVVDTGSVDNQNHRIRVFDTGSGEHLYDIGTRGSEAGQFNLPRDIELDADGRIHVVDGANFRVQILEQDGTPVSSFGGIGRKSGLFSRPKGIGIDPAGNIYVSDAAFGNYQIFNPDGQLLLFVGSRGTKPGRAKYMLPSGLHVDEDGRIYMVDQFFRKVDIYRPAGLAQEEGYLGVWYRAPDAKEAANK